MPKVYRIVYVCVASRLKYRHHQSRPKYLLNSMNFYYVQDTFKYISMCCTLSVSNSTKYARLSICKYTYTVLILYIIQYYLLFLNLKRIMLGNMFPLVWFVFYCLRNLQILIIYMYFLTSLWIQIIIWASLFITSEGPLNLMCILK